MKALEPNEITVRLATKDDRNTFIKLWRAYLQEEFELGGELLPNEYNAAQAAVLFNSYIRGHLYGLVMLAFHGNEPVGTAMIGEDFAGSVTWETRRGRSVNVWGDYVIPEYRRRGISHKMLNYPKDILREMGFNGGYSSTKFEEASEMNAYNFGVEKLAVQFYYDLRKKD